MVLDADMPLAVTVVAPQPPAAPVASSPVPDLRYGGFRATSEGREYTLRVSGLLDKREFVVLIEHAVFTARLVSFQDAPGLCFAKVRRALAADAGLQPGEPLVLSAEELSAHRQAVERTSGPRKRARPDVPR